MHLQLGLVSPSTDTARKSHSTTQIQESLHTTLRSSPGAATGPFWGHNNFVTCVVHAYVTCVGISPKDCWSLYLFWLKVLLPFLFPQSTLYRTISIKSSSWNLRNFKRNLCLTSGKIQVKDNFFHMYDLCVRCCTWGDKDDSPCLEFRQGNSVATRVLQKRMVLTTREPR